MFHAEYNDILELPMVPRNVSERTQIASNKMGENVNFQVIKMCNQF